MVIKKACTIVALAVVAGVVGLFGCGENAPEPETPKQEDVCAPGYRLCINRCKEMQFGGLCFNCCRRKHLLCRYIGRYEFDECLE